VAISFCRHGELNIPVVRDPLSSSGAWEQVMKRVILVMKPAVECGSLPQ
jgi:hypothetical protein